HSLARPRLPLLIFPRPRACRPQPLARPRLRLRARRPQLLARPPLRLRAKPLLHRVTALTPACRNPNPRLRLQQKRLPHRCCCAGDALASAPWAPPRVGGARRADTPEGAEKQLRPPLLGGPPPGESPAPKNKVILGVPEPPIPVLSIGPYGEIKFGPIKTPA